MPHPGRLRRACGDLRGGQIAAAGDAVDCRNFRTAEGDARLARKIASRVAPAKMGKDKLTCSRRDVLPREQGKRPEGTLHGVNARYTGTKQMLLSLLYSTVSPEMRLTA